MSATRILIGQNIRRHRKAAAYTQEQLAARTGLTNDFISRLELGKQNPRLATVVKICDALNIRAAQLFEEGE